MDPLVGETETPYAFAGGDPVNASDPLGLLGWGTITGALGKIVHAVKNVGQAALDVGLVGPYAIYAGSLEAARGINQIGCHFDSGQARDATCALSHALAAPLIVPQGIGIGVDIAGDEVKHYTVSPGETWNDEQRPGYWNPVHRWCPGWLKGPETNLPGIGPTDHWDYSW